MKKLASLFIFMLFAVVAQAQITTVNKLKIENLVTHSPVVSTTKIVVQDPVTLELKYIELSSITTGTGTDDQTASEVPVVDINSYFNTSNVESILAEIGAAIQTLQSGGSDGNEYISNVVFSGTDLTFTSSGGGAFGGIIDLSSLAPLIEADVDAFVSNNGYLTSEVDGSITNEVQDISLTNDIFSISLSPSTVDLSPYLDNTDNQNASQVPVADSNDYYLGTNAEDIFDEIGQQLSNQQISYQSISSDITLSANDINNFTQFVIVSGTNTITIPTTSLAANEIRYLMVVNTTNNDFTLVGDAGVTFPSTTYSDTKVVTLYSINANTWLEYNVEPDNGSDGNDFLTSLGLSANVLTATIPNQSNVTVDLSSLVGTDDQNAEEVTIADAGGYFTGNTVEAALQQLGLQGGTNRMLEYVPITSNTTLNVADINEVKTFVVTSGTNTITIPQTTLDTNEMKLIVIINETNNDVTITGDTGVTFSSSTYTGKNIISLYSNTQNVWQEYSILPEDNQYVSLTGNETVNGVKTFNDAVESNTAFSLSNAVLDVFSGSIGRLVLDNSIDNNKLELFGTGVWRVSNNTNYVEFGVLNFNSIAQNYDINFQLGNGTVAFLSDIVDNSPSNEFQRVDVFSLNGTDLEISLSDDNTTNSVVDLSSLQDGIGTDDQTASEVTSTAVGNLSSTTVQTALEELQTDIDNLTAGGSDGNDFVNSFNLTGTTLEAVIPNQTNPSIDLSPLQDGTGTDNQTLAEVLTQGNTANTTINMNSNNIINVRDIWLDDASIIEWSAGGNFSYNGGSDILTWSGELNVNGVLRTGFGVNRYSFPEEKGNIGQVMVVNGTGNLVFQDPFTPSTLLADYSFTDNSSDWNTAFGWGNHATAGYLELAGGTMTGNINMGNNSVTNALNVNATVGAFSSNVSTPQLDNEGDVIVQVDSDNNGSNSYLVKDGAGNNLMSITEDGRTDFAGHILVDYSVSTEEDTSIIDLSGAKQIDFGGTPSGFANYTLTNINTGGYAEILHNSMVEPTVTGATKLPATALFTPGKDMILCIKDFNGTRKYWFVQF